MNKNNKTVLYIVIVTLAIVAVAFIVGSNRGNGSNPVPVGNITTSNLIGSKAFDFSLPDINGRTVKLSDLKGKNIVLFFNEGQMCYPACWNQIESLGNDARFNTTDTVAFSIVVDTPTQWEDIENQMPQFKKAEILFDVDRTVSSQYGVLSMASSMHPGNFPGHTYFVIDKNGIIRFFLDDPMMAVRNDQLADEINKLK